MNNLKYGIIWRKSSKNVYYGIHPENNLYLILATNESDRWSFELLTYQKCRFTGKYEYELPQRESSRIFTDDVEAIATEVDRRIKYWKSEDRRWQLARR